MAQPMPCPPVASCVSEQHRAAPQQHVESSPAPLLKACSAGNSQDPAGHLRPTSPPVRKEPPEVAIGDLDELSLSTVIRKAATTPHNLRTVQLLSKRFRGIALHLATSVHLCHNAPLPPFSSLRTMRISAPCSALPWSVAPHSRPPPALATLTCLEIDGDVALSDSEAALLPAKLARLRALRVLVINNTPAALQAVRSADSLPALEAATFSLVKASGLDLTALQPLGGLSGVVHLDLAGSDVPDSGLQPIGSLAGLQTLDLSNCRGLRSGLRHLTGLSGLRALSLLGCNKLDPASLTHLSTLTSLRALDLSYLGRTLTNPDDSPTGPLRHVAALPALEALFLTSNCVTDSDLTHVGALTSLHVLDLRYNLVTSAGLRSVTRLSALTHLVLSFEVLLDGWGHLARLPALRALSLDDLAQLTADDMRTVAALPALEHLHLGDLESVPELTPLTRLTSLSLAFYHEQDNVSFDALQRLSALTQLRALRVRVDSDDAQPLLPHLSALTQLRALHVAEDYYDAQNLCGRGLMHLSQLSGLQDLTLETCGRLDTELRHVSCLRGLETLCLDTRRVTDRDLQRVVSSGVGSLAVLRLPHVGRVTGHGVRCLHQLPGLHTVVVDQPGGLLAGGEPGEARLDALEVVKAASRAWFAVDEAWRPAYE